MRKNVKNQLALRVLSTAALMAMVSSIATAAFADTYDLNKGSVTVETKENGITYVTQLDNTQKDGYARNDKDDILHDYQDKTGVTITSGGEKTSNTITVETAKDQTTDVTLDKVHIEVNTSEAKSGAIEIKGDGNTNLELNGDNTVLTTNSTAEEHAAIEKADPYGKGTLTIKDDVNDDGSEKTGTDADTTGTLLAGGYHMAAAATVPARTSALKAMPMLLPLLNRVPGSAVVPAVETASPLRTMLLSMLVLILTLQLEVAMTQAVTTALILLRSPEMLP